MLYSTLIVSEAEWQVLVGLVCDSPSEALKQLMAKMIESPIKNNDTLQSLIGKRLVRQSGQEMVFEPLVYLLVNEAVAATSFQELKSKTYALICGNICLLFEPYKHAENMWRIVPFQDMEKLLDFLQK